MAASSEDTTSYARTGPSTMPEIVRRALSREASSLGPSAASGHSQNSNMPRRWTWKSGDGVEWSIQRRPSSWEDNRDRNSPGQPLATPGPRLRNDGSNERGSDAYTTPRRPENRLGLDRGVSSQFGMPPQGNLPSGHSVRILPTGEDSTAQVPGMHLVGGLPQNPAFGEQSSGGASHRPVSTPRFSGAEAHQVVQKHAVLDRYLKGLDREQWRTCPNALSLRSTIHSVVNSINPEIQLEPEVEKLLVDIADEFIESVADFGCRLAQHRGSDTLEVKDLQLHLERNLGIRIPGFSSDMIPMSQFQAVVPAATSGAAAKGPKMAMNQPLTLREQRMAQVQDEKDELARERAEEAARRKRFDQVDSSGVQRRVQ